MSRDASVPAVAALPLAIALLLGGCEEIPRREPPPLPPDSSVAGGPAIRPGREPDALMIRFREVKGEGFSRESWEIEILQMGSDVRVRGSFRSGGTSVPIYRPMSGTEYAELWAWLRGFPLDRHQVRVDEAAPPADWKKTFELDVVLGPDERWLAKNTWSRPLAEGEFIHRIETRLHGLILDFTEEEVARMQQAGPDVPVPAGDPGLEDGVRETLEALGDTRSLNLPGGDLGDE